MKINNSIMALSRYHFKNLGKSIVLLAICASMLFNLQTLYDIERPTTCPDVKHIVMVADPNYTNVTTTAPKRITTTPPPTTKTTSDILFPLSLNMTELVNALQEKKKWVENITIINPHPFTYSINSKVCDFKSDMIKIQKFSLLILVKSAAGYFQKRDKIRKTWGNVTSKSVRLVFLLGTSHNHTNKIRDESSKYSDIVQEDFIDSYHNNTYKTIMGFNWAVTNCQKAKYLFFVDDDYVVNMTNLVQFLVKHGSENIYTGHRLTNAKPFRKKSNKWYVSYENYPSKKYPPYLTGGAYIIAMNHARRFYYAFPYVKYLFVDDCYLGIVALKLGINSEDNKNFQMYGCSEHFFRTGIACHNAK